MSVSLSPLLQDLQQATANFYAALRNFEAAIGVEGLEESIEKGGSVSSVTQIENAISNISTVLSPAIPVGVIPTRLSKSQTFVAVKNNLTAAQPFFPTSPTPNRIATFICPASNMGNFYLGDSTVNKTQYGAPLQPDTDIDYTIDDLSKIFWLADVVGDQIVVDWEWGYGKITP